jgi:RimJ/RimL family protein N-acetyltransferase
MTTQMALEETVLFSEADLPALTSILGNPANTQDDLSVATMSAAELEAVARKWLTLTVPLSGINFVVEIDGKVQGISGLGWIGDAVPAAEDGRGQHAMVDQPACARVGAAGIVLDPAVRGKGYAFEALRLSIEFGLEKLELIEVHLGTPSRNAAMVGLMEKRFGMPARKNEVDKFGNDATWNINKEMWENGKEGRVNGTSAS